MPEETEEPAEAAASLAEAATKPAQDPPKLRSILVSVPEPSRGKVREGKIQPFAGGRTRSSSGGSRSSIGTLRWGRDVWKEAELYLTDTSLCYSISDTGVSFTNSVK